MLALLTALVMTAPLGPKGLEHRVEFDSSRPKTIAIKRNGRTLWEGIKRELRPFSLNFCDIDGDRSNDLVFGVYKSTRNLPKPHNTIYIYGFDGKAAYPMWRGSSIGTDFSEFTCGRLNGVKGQRVVTIERLGSERWAVGVYRWHKFGLRKEWSQGSWKLAVGLRVKDGTIRLRAEGQDVTVAHSGS